MSPKKQAAFSFHRRRVAVLIESSMASGRQVLDGITRYVHQADPWSIYHEPGHVQNRVPEWLESWSGDGILARIRSKELAKALLAKDVPVVDVLGNSPHPDIPVVKVNDPAIAKLAISHLMDRGFRSFGYCGMQGAMWSQRRYKSFNEIVTKLGYELLDCQLSPSFSDRTWFSKAQRERLVRWIHRLSKPCGVMACNDITAQKILQACQQAKVMVPEEVAVIGVDNDVTLCKICDPMLSSIIAGHDQVGFRGAELLDRLMQGKSVSKEPQIVGVPDIAVRQSTDALTVDNLDVVAAVRFIRENACTDIGVKDVTSHVAISYSTLTRQFHRVLSRSIHDEILRVRIQRARDLLQDTKLTLGQISQLVGFKHQEYFGKIFRTTIGMTPGQYRRETHKPDDLAK